ncbi:MAG: MGMT family protein [Oscillospiraceae bacterium]|jgi:methylated-DNA-protein-cysteine methyltransferase-like protein|nr:MGMT family protein [Oscillospiraceae bacterium]
MNSFAQIYEIVKQIPSGRVATYGQIAMLAGNPKWSRVVGYALHANPEFGVIPCHRVLNRFGEVCEGFAFGGSDAQRSMLEAEGVEFELNGHVSLERFRWKGLRD